MQGRPGSNRSAAVAATPREALEHFDWHWRRRQPVLVRGCPETRQLWNPPTLIRAFTESGNQEVRAT